MLGREYVAREMLMLAIELNNSVQKRTRNNGLTRVTLSKS